MDNIQILMKYLEMLSSISSNNRDINDILDKTKISLIAKINSTLEIDIYSSDKKPSKEAEFEINFNQLRKQGEEQIKSIAETMISRLKDISKELGTNSELK